MHDVKVDFSSAEEILRKHGFQRGGPVQRLFTSEVKESVDHICLLIEV